MSKQKIFSVEYRGEFATSVYASNRAEAISEFKRKLKDYIVCDLHEDYLQVFNDKGFEVE
jgi:hypothetical protein